MAASGIAVICLRVFRRGHQGLQVDPRKGVYFYLPPVLSLASRGPAGFNVLIVSSLTVWPITASGQLLTTALSTTRRVGERGWNFKSRCAAGVITISFSDGRRRIGGAATRLPVAADGAVTVDLLRAKTNWYILEKGFAQ